MKKILSYISWAPRREALLFGVLMGTAMLKMLAIWYCGRKGMADLAANVSLAYLLAIAVSAVPCGRHWVTKVPRWSVSGCVMAYSVVLTLMGGFGAVFIKNPSAMNTLVLIMQTNGQETKEFFSYFVGWKTVGLSLAGIGLAGAGAWGIYRTFKHTEKQSIQKNSKLVLTLQNSITVCCLLLVVSMQVFHWDYTGHTQELSILTEHWDRIFGYHDLRNYVKMPNVNETREVHPETVVMIIGESHCRSHSGLLGYEKQTNPKLQRLVNSGNLVALDSVITPAAYTGEAIIQIMSTYPEDGSNSSTMKPWWECQTIPTTMKACGYKTYWLTNQNGGATRDVIADNYGHLCDVFGRTKYVKVYDEELLALLDFIKQSEGHQKKSKNKFFVFHLMGSHEDFSERYPRRFERFKSSDYMGYPECQRVKRAAYDNSILYNDYVVSSIIDQFSSQSSIVIYFPDHALDFFQTDPNYAAHATGNEWSQWYARQIPMYIYLSDAYMQADTSAYERLKRNEHKRLNTGYFIYSLLSLVGYTFEYQR